MATTPSNTAVYPLQGEIPAVPIGGTDAINQGDIVVWDSSLNSGAGGMRVAAAQADMAKYLGVSGQTNPVTSIGGNIDNANVASKGVFKFNTTAGETYYMFDPVYLSETADAQTIIKATNTGARTVPVGYIILPQDLVLAGVTSITGASGVTIPVALTPNFPSASVS